MYLTFYRNAIAFATVEAGASRKVRESRQELELSRYNEKELSRQLDESKATSRSIQSTLAAVVAEKERLIAENEEMKAVCEELMAMMEGKQGERQP